MISLEMSLIRSKISNCARCGEDHYDLAFSQLKEPAENYTHWAECPTTGEPILMALIPRPRSQRENILKTGGTVQVELPPTFGGLVRKARLSAKMGLSELGERLGLSLAYVGEVERGVSKPFQEKHFERLVSILPSLDTEELRRLARVERGEVSIPVTPETPESVFAMIDSFEAMDWAKISEAQVKNFLASLGGQDER